MTEPIPDTVTVDRDALETAIRLLAATPTQLPFVQMRELLDKLSEPFAPAAAPPEEPPTKEA